MSNIRRPRRGVKGVFWMRAGACPRAAAPRGSPTPADEWMMERALMLAARAAEVGEVPIGAVVYETATGRALAEAFNRRETDRDPSAHAEHIAIVQAAKVVGDWRLNHCTVAVTLEPCAMCAGLIVNARLGRLVYGAADPKAGACESLYAITADPRLNHRPEVVAGVRADTCAAMLARFFSQLRSKKGAAGGR